MKRSSIFFLLFLGFLICPTVLAFTPLGEIAPDPVPPVDPDYDPFYDDPGLLVITKNSDGSTSTGTTSQTGTEYIPEEVASTVIEDIPEFSGNTLTVFGDLSKLYEDYVDISIESPNQDYVRSSVGGIAITNYYNDGVVGVSKDGNPVFKYRMQVDFYVLIYTTYPAQYFYSLTPETKSVDWLRVDRAGAMSWGDIFETFMYSIEYKDYVETRAATKTNGGEFDLDINMKFDLPWSDLADDQYKMLNLKTAIVSLNTAPDDAVIGRIGTTDMRYNQQSQSSTISSYTRKNEVVDFDFGDASQSDLQNEINRVQPGWKSEGATYPVSDNVMNNVAMGTNIRLATGQTSLLSGTYQCNIGASAFHQQQEIKIKYAQLRIDVRGPWTGCAAMAVSDKTVSRTVAVGVDNNFIKQKMRSVIEIYSEVEELQAEYTPEELGEVEEPVYNETINFDPEISGDEAVEVQGVQGFFKSDTFILMLVGIVLLGGVIGIVYLKFQFGGVKKFVWNY